MEVDAKHTRTSAKENFDCQIYSIGFIMLHKIYNLLSNCYCDIFVRHRVLTIGVGQGYGLSRKVTIMDYVVTISDQ